MKPQEPPKEFPSLVWWLLVLSTAYLSALAMSVIIGLIIPGSVSLISTAGFIWGGSLMAPIKHWSVRTALFAFVQWAAYSLQPPGHFSAEPIIQTVIGGVAGIILVEFTLWFYPKIEKARTKNET